MMHVHRSILHTLEWVMAMAQQTAAGESVQP
jgi:hypothetical protein